MFFVWFFKLRQPVAEAAKGENSFIISHSPILVFSGEQFFLFELPGVERGQETWQFSYLCTEGDPGSAIWDSSEQCEIIVFVLISARQEGEGWEGHEDSKRLRQMQSKFSGNCFIEVASFAGIWLYSKLYPDNELYKQSAVAWIFSMF